MAGSRDAVNSARRQRWRCRIATGRMRPPSQGRAGHGSASSRVPEAARSSRKPVLLHKMLETMRGRGALRRGSAGQVRATTAQPQSHRRAQQGPAADSGRELLALAHTAGALLVHMRTDVRSITRTSPTRSRSRCCAPASAPSWPGRPTTNTRIVFVGDDEDGRRAELLAVAVGIRKLGSFLYGGSRSWQQENRDVVPRHVIPVVEGIVPKWEARPPHRSSRLRRAGRGRTSRNAAGLSEVAVRRRARSPR